MFPKVFQRFRSSTSPTNCTPSNSLSGTSHFEFWLHVASHCWFPGSSYIPVIYLFYIYSSYCLLFRICAPLVAIPFVLVNEYLVVLSPVTCTSYFNILYLISWEGFKLPLATSNRLTSLYLNNTSVNRLLLRLQQEQGVLVVVLHPVDLEILLLCLLVLLCLMGDMAWWWWWCMRLCGNGTITNKVDFEFISVDR